MQLSMTKFNIKEVEECLHRENKFITDLLRRACIPERKGGDSSDEGDEDRNIPKLPFKTNFNKTSRAKSLSELQQRLDAIKGKKKQTYKEKLAKKGLKNRLKKKTQQDQRNAEKKLQRAVKLTTKQEINTEEPEPKMKEVIQKPIFNKDDKIVFSKIDFDNIGKQKKAKQEKDPKKLLERLQKQNETLQKLKDSGEIEKAIEIKEKSVWKNALAKAEGIKVKDDPVLLKKSVKKKEQKQRSSKKKWEQRQEKVEKAKMEKQDKRKENILKRKKDKKHKKMKTSVKKGKVIPGF